MIFLVHRVKIINQSFVIKDLPSEFVLHSLLSVADILNSSLSLLLCDRVSSAGSVTRVSSRSYANTRVSVAFSRVPIDLSR